MALLSSILMSRRRACALLTKNTTVCSQNSASMSYLATRRQPSTLQNRGFATGVKLLEQKGKGQEDVYFAAEDEKLIKKLLDNPDFAADSALSLGDSTEEKIKLVFLDHGIPPLNKRLIADLAAILGPKK